MDQLQTVEDDSALIDFWDNFRLSRFRVVTQPTYTAAITLLPYGTLLAAALIADLIGDGNTSWTKEALTLWPMLIATAAMLLIFWTYYRWRSQIPAFFSWIYGGQRIASPEGDLRPKYEQYLQEYQDRLNSIKGPLLMVVLALAFVVIFSWITGIPQKIIAEWNEGNDSGIFRAIRFFIIWFYGFTIWAILCGLAAWPVYVTGRQLAALSDRFDVVVQPTHPDQCGGLKSLGDFCFDMTLPVVIGGLILAVFGFGHSYLLEAGIIVYETIIPVANAALFLVIVPLTGITFFVPVFGLHEKMVQMKKVFEDRYAGQATVLEEQIKANLDEPERLANARKAAEELEVLRVLMPNDFSYPEWPFDRSMPVKLFASPVLSLALQFLVDLFSRSSCCS